MVGNNDLQKVKNTYILLQEDLELEFLHLNGVPLYISILQGKFVFRACFWFILL